jgi:hypothetical protein
MHRAPKILLEASFVGGATPANWELHQSQVL